MSKQKFTPGPWTVEDHSPHFHMIVGPEGIDIIAGTWARPHVANARLIAAAPRLFAALSALATPDIDEHPEDFAAEWLEARAALAEARGEP